MFTVHIFSLILPVIYVKCISYSESITKEKNSFSIVLFFHTEENNNLLLPPLVDYEGDVEGDS